MLFSTAHKYSLAILDVFTLMMSNLSPKISQPDSVFVNSNHLESSLLSMQSMFEKQKPLTDISSERLLENGNSDFIETRLIDVERGFFGVELQDLEESGF